VQHCITAGYGNTPYYDKGYYHDRLEIFCNINESSSEASTPTCGGDAFGTELTKSCWFGSSGLNLTFEGLLLGVSIRMLAEGTHSEPRQSGFWIHNALTHAMGVSALFCRRLKASRVSKRRLQWINGTKACRTTQAKVRCRRGTLVINRRLPHLFDTP
jgi:hypothetical protein